MSRIKKRVTSGLIAIKIKASAAKALGKIKTADRGKIVDAIDRLADTPHAGSALKGEFAGLRRIRVGGYRVIYEVDDGVLLVLVIRIAHRREVYR